MEVIYPPMPVMIPINEFARKIGFDKTDKKHFKTNDTAIRYHKDDENMLQKIYQILASYFKDDDADELTTDPVLTAILDKNGLASQPTMSRFFNRMDEDTLNQFDCIHKQLSQKIYSIENPEMVLFDIDSTLLNTYGKQEGRISITITRTWLSSIFML